jgi:hypothetical protein
LREDGGTELEDHDARPERRGEAMELPQNLLLGPLGVDLEAGDRGDASVPDERVEGHGRSDLGRF